MRQRRVVRARAYEIPQNVRHLKSLGLGLFGRACGESRILPRALNHPSPQPPPSQSISLVRQGVTSIGMARTKGRKRRALWELDLKALHFSDAAKRKHLSSASAPDCLCLQLPRELLQPSPACENKPRSGEYYGDGNFLIVPKRVNVRPSEFPSLILS